MKESSNDLKLGKCPRCQEKSLQLEGEAKKFLWCSVCDLIIEVREDDFIDVNKTSQTKGDL